MLNYVWRGKKALPIRSPSQLMKWLKFLMSSAWRKFQMQGTFKLWYWTLQQLSLWSDISGEMVDAIYQLSKPTPGGSVGSVKMLPKRCPGIQGLSVAETICERSGQETVVSFSSILHRHSGSCSRQDCDSANGGNVWGCDATKGENMFQCSYCSTKLRFIQSDERKPGFLSSQV